MSTERAKTIQLIHIGKAKLGLDDGTYRAMLHTLTGVESCSAMTVPQLEAVLKHLCSRGFQLTGAASFPGRPKNIGQHLLLQKIEAQLADLKLPWAYARSICTRMFGKVLEFCTAMEWKAIVTALAQKQTNEGKGEHR